MQIIDKCYGNNSNYIVIAVNSSKHFLKNQIKKVRVLSLVGLNHSEVLNSNALEFHSEWYALKYFEAISKPFPANLFLITEINLSFLKRTLAKLKNSIWWNVYGFFIIQLTEVNTCKEAYAYLSLIWKFNVLNVIYLCLDKNFQTESYTFNPYSSEAPKEWFKIESTFQENGHPLTLFKLSSDFGGKYIHFKTCF